MNPLDFWLLWLPVGLFAFGASYPLWGIPLYWAGTFFVERKAWGRTFIVLGCLAFGGQLLAIIVLMAQELALRMGWMLL
jgi:hypothetical protein